MTLQQIASQRDSSRNPRAFPLLAGPRLKNRAGLLPIRAARRLFWNQNAVSEQTITPAGSQICKSPRRNPRRCTNLQEMVPGGGTRRIPACTALKPCLECPQAGPGFLHKPGKKNDCLEWTQDGMRKRRTTAWRERQKNERPTTSCRSRDRTPGAACLPHVAWISPPPQTKCCIPRSLARWR
jgi:hypothetical protein